MTRIKGNPRPTVTVHGALNKNASAFDGGTLHERVQVKLTVVRHRVGLPLFVGYRFNDRIPGSVASVGLLIYVFCSQ
jgi:hypothetical protein